MQTNKLLSVLGLNRAARRAPKKLRSLGDLTVIVPTINSAKYIDIILEYYSDELSIPVMLFVDSKTIDRTTPLARSLAAKVVPIQNDATRVGEIIQRMSMVCPTSWVLRIDDDELPSRAMIDYVLQVVRSGDADAYGFRRYQCLVSSDGRLLNDPQSTHVQWRLYRKDSVRYIAAGHTPGFQTQGLKIVEAPQDALMIHLDWALHSYDERKSKIFRYDSHTANHGSIWRHYYLYEEQSGMNFRRLPAPEFDATCHKIAKRLPELTLK